jgi:hypothetical protein
MNLHPRELCFFAIWLAVTPIIAQQNTKTPPIALSEIQEQYANNAMKGDLLYKGKYFAVQGKVVSVETSRDSRFRTEVGRVLFESFSPRELTGNTWGCGFDTGHIKEMATLMNGDHVTLYGQFEGLMNFQHCSLVSDEHILAVSSPTIPDPKLGFFPPQNTDKHQCPIEAVRIVPRVYSFRVTSAGEDGWRPLNKMALDLTVRDTSDKNIAAMWFEISTYNGAIITDWDDVRADIKTVGEKSLYFPTNGHLIELNDSFTPATVKVTLTKIKYSDGMIAYMGCELGTALIPKPFHPLSASPNSPVFTLEEGISPPRVLDSRRGRFFQNRKTAEKRS